VKTILDQSHLTPFPLQQAPIFWSYDHTLRLYPLPTTLVLCDTSGWGPFKVTYEGCCVINIGSLLKVEAEGQRGRYAASWWEWDCGVREGREIRVALTDREEGSLGRLDKRERKRKSGLTEGTERLGNGAREIGEHVEIENDRQVEELQIGETQVEETQAEEMFEREVEESQVEVQMEGIEY